MALPTYWREAASVMLVGRYSPPRKSTADSKVLMMKRSEKVQHTHTHTLTHTFRFVVLTVNL